MMTRSAPALPGSEQGTWKSGPKFTPAMRYIVLSIHYLQSTTAGTADGSAGKCSCPASLSSIFWFWIHEGRRELTLNSYILTSIQYTYIMTHECLYSHMHTYNTHTKSEWEREERAGTGTDRQKNTTLINGIKLHFKCHVGAVDLI